MTEVRPGRKAEDLPRCLESWKEFARSMADVVLLVRRDGEILATNRPPASFDAAGTVGQNVFDFAPQMLRSRLLESLESIFRGEEPQVREIPSERPDGTIRWFATHAGVIHEDTQPVAATVAMRDITAQKAAQQELRASEERYRSLVERETRLQTQFRNLSELERKRDSLVQMLVHDLRSPLTALFCNLMLLRDEAEPLLPPDLMASLHDAERLADDIAHMVSDMLNVSRFEDGVMPLEITDGDLVSIATEAVRAVAPKTGVDVRLEADHSTIPVRCDRLVIMRVITNLVSNAIKATRSGGTVTLHVTNERVVSVKDSGAGIPPALQARLFDKYWRSAGEFGMRRGTGLGLAFCKLAIDAHGGLMDVRSEPDTGTTFKFTLPGNL